MPFLSWCSSCFFCNWWENLCTYTLFCKRQSNALIATTMEQNMCYTLSDPTPIRIYSPIPSLPTLIFPSTYTPTGGPHLPLSPPPFPNPIPLPTCPTFVFHSLMAKRDYLSVLICELFSTSVPKYTLYFWWHGFHMYSTNMRTRQGI